MNNNGSVSVLVILDNVRAQSTSVCGYDRPTTPNLERIVSDGAHINCDAWAPGSWTLPSHASFFTGLEVPEHHAHLVDQKSKRELGERNLGPARGLDPDFVTIAELRTAHLVSANPVLGSASGLNQGFVHTHIAERFGDTYGDDFVKGLQTILEKAQDGDLIVLNIADAHTPWTDVPEGLDWLPSRKTVKYRTRNKRNIWRKWHNGRREKKMGRRIVDVYDYAIFRADQTLGKALETIDSQGFSIRDLTITSDHGEHVGEHGLLGHGHYLTEENQRVPLITTHPIPDGPISATVVYDLATGSEPKLRPIRAASYPHRRKNRFFKRKDLYGQIRVRSWDPDIEWTSPEDIPENDFGKFVEQAVESGVPTSDQSDLESRLEALGYL